MTYRCDNCGAECAFAPQTRVDGAYEVGYMRCGSCGNDVIAYVSDTALRESIQRYQLMANMIRGGEVTERLIRSAQRLKSQNVARSRKLREEYILRSKEV